LLITLWIKWKFVEKEGMGVEERNGDGVCISTREIYDLLLEVRDQVRDLRNEVTDIREKKREEGDLRGDVAGLKAQVKWLWAIVSVIITTIIGAGLKALGVK